MSAFDPSCIDVEDFLECLDIEAEEATEKEMLFSCPFPTHPGNDNNPSCYMNRETTAYFCQSCHARGNAIRFTQDLLGISPLEAIRMLRARYSPGGVDPSARSMREEVKKVLDAEPPTPSENSVLPEGLVERFSVDWQKAHHAWARREGHPATDYMFDRGFDPVVLEEWEFGYDPHSDRITFAVRDEHENLVGFKGRTWQADRHPKYLILGDSPRRNSRYGFPCFQISLLIYGLERAINHNETLAEGEAHLIVCEGELNVVSLYQKGYRNAVAIQGSNFSGAQAALLRMWADSVTLFLDSDQAGLDATQTIADSLIDFMPVRVVPDHEGDPASMSAEEVDRVLDEARGYAADKLLRSR